MTTLDDPLAMSAHSWKTRKASLISHGFAADHPRVIACDDALAYWRFRESLDRGVRDGLIPAGLRDDALALTLAEIRSKRAELAAPQTCDPDSSGLESMVAQPDRTAEEVGT